MLSETMILHDGAAMVKHVRWDELKKELLNPKLERQHVSGKQLTLARLLMRKGLVTEEHSHLHEQFAYVLEGALKFTVNGQEQIVRSGEVRSDRYPVGTRQRSESSAISGLRTAEGRQKT
jgi:quercetin dioxygenase-like cupin family protein